MKTKKIFESAKSKLLFFVMLCLTVSFVFAQNPPPNTRLMQLNTKKGSILNLVESNDNFTYHVGIMNSNEVGFDGLTSTNIGFDDLFIAKSNSATGTNIWFKTFNAGNGGIISPKYIYVDSSENVYVFGGFSGSITTPSGTITSSGSNDAFLMKINSSGNAVWATYFANGINLTYSRVKCKTDGTDTFLIYNKSHLARLNDTNGSIIYDNVYSTVELRSLELQSTNLYVAGYTYAANVIIGTESIATTNTGFILKGDKNANFTASATTTKLGAGTDINDIAFSSDGNLLLSGFSAGTLSLVSETSTFAYTYNPNTSFVTNKVYTFVAKIDANLSTVSFFRISSPMSSDYVYGIESRVFLSRLIPYGSSGNFKNLLYVSDRYGNVTSFTNTNGTTTNISITPTQFYNVLLSNDSSGNYLTASQPFFVGFKMSASGNYYTQTTVTVRNFVNKNYNASSGAEIWNKQKLASEGGTLSLQFQKHLNSAKSELFFTTLAEGKINFFGSQFNKTPGNYFRLITRLGNDGLKKWVAQFSNEAGTRQLNISNDFACVDKDDNFLFLAKSSSNAYSTFTDAIGNSIDFSPSSENLIKLDKDGKYLWSKTLTNISAGAITTDANGDVYVLGIGGFIVMKFNGTDGNNIYTKSYNCSAYSILPVFDSQNNLYIFTEPINIAGTNYTFDNIIIPTVVDYHTDHLMLKLDATGNVIWGKNFYAGNSGNYNYSWPNDVVFDGTDFIVMGNYYTNSTAPNFSGLDLENIPKVYSNVTYNSFFAKVKTDGTVVWQKPIHSNVNMTGNYTNFDIDENKNSYMFYSLKDKINYNGTEYSFDSNKGNKIIIKLDTNGNLNYYKNVDKGIYNTYVDVIGEDKINVSAFTNENNILNYAIDNNNGSNLYVATFGDLVSKYLTPENNYLILNNVDVTNNPNNANTFSFDLINNVNWSATSDQNWLNLSFLNLTGKKSSATISGNGDAKITLTANTNNTGSTRSANVMISGDQGVASKTVIVTQTAVLGTNESKTFVMVLYPNPTSDVLNIQSQEKISGAEIYDISGKLILKSNVQDKKINVNTLQKGTYLIKLYTEKGIVNSKFIKN